MSISNSSTPPAVEWRRWFGVEHDKPRAACFVCSRYASISHWHHAPAISEVQRAGILAYDIRGFKWPMFSLCPNHHAIVHALGGSAGEAALRELGEDEAKRIDEIRAAESAAWEELYAYRRG